MCSPRPFRHEPAAPQCLTVSLGPSSEALDSLPGQCLSSSSKSKVPCVTQLISRCSLSRKQAQREQMSHQRRLASALRGDLLSMFPTSYDSIDLLMRCCKCRSHNLGHSLPSSLWPRALSISAAVPVWDLIRLLCSQGPWGPWPARRRPRPSRRAREATPVARA